MNVKNATIWKAYLPDISLLLSTVIWGMSFTIMKVMLGDQISPYLFVFLRFAAAAVLLYPICRKRLPGLGSRGLGAGAFLGILLYAGFITQAVGIVFTTASKSAFITGISSVFVPIFLIAHQRRLPEPLMAVAILIAMAGMFLLTNPVGGGFNLGDFLTLLCAISFAAQIYTMGLAAIKYDTLALTFVQLATTAVLAGLALFFVPIFFIVTWKGIAALAFMTILGTAAALTVQTWAQKKTPAVRAGLIYSAEPVFAYMFASALLGEGFEIVQKLGGAIIILAVISSELVPLYLARNGGKRTA